MHAAVAACSLLSSACYVRNAPCKCRAPVFYRHRGFYNRSLGQRVLATEIHRRSTGAASGFQAAAVVETMFRYDRTRLFHAVLKSLVLTKCCHVMKFMDHRRSMIQSLLLLLHFIDGVYSASARAQPYIVASGRTFPGSKSSDGMLRLPQVISWSATKLSTNFYGSHVSLNLTTASHEEASLSLQFMGIYMPLELNLIGPVNLTHTCLVGVPALPCIVQGLPMGNYSLAIKKARSPFFRFQAQVSLYNEGNAPSGGPTTAKKRKTLLLQVSEPRSGEAVLHSIDIGKGR